MEENLTKPGFVERRMKQMVEIAALEHYPYYDGDNSNVLKREAFKNGLLSKAAKEYHIHDMISQELVTNFIRANFLTAKWDEYMDQVSHNEVKELRERFEKDADDKFVEENFSGLRELIEDKDIAEFYIDLIKNSYSYREEK